MAKDKNCFDAVKESIERAEVKLTGAQLEKIRQNFNVLEAIRENANRDPSLGTFQERSQAYYQTKKEAVKKSIASNAKRLETDVFNAKYVDQPAFTSGKDGAKEAILSRLVQPDRPGNNSALSAENLREVLENKVKNLRAEMLERAGATKRYESGQDDLAIMQAIHAIKKNESTAGFDKDIQAMAEMHVAVDKLILKTSNDLGIPLGDLKDRIMLRQYDPEKLLTLGRDGFVQFQQGLNIDRVRTFGEFAGDAEKEAEILGRFYDHKVAGKENSGTETDADAFGFTPTADRKGIDPFDRFALSRGIHYGDPASEYTANVKLGRGNLASTLDADIRNKASQIALINTFGPNPREGFLNLIDNTYNKLMAKGDRLSIQQANELIRTNGGRKEYSKLLTWRFDHYNALNSLPLSEKIDAITRVATGIQAVSKLGGHGLSAFPSTGVALLMSKDMTGSSLASLTTDFLKNYTKSMVPSVREAALREIGQAADDMSGYLQLQNRGTKFDKAVNKTLNVLDFVGAAKFNFESPRVIAGTHFVRQAARALEAPSKMTPEIKSLLLQGGIGETEMNVLRAGLEKVDGKYNFTPTSIARMDVTEPTLVAAAKEAGQKPATYLLNLELKQGALINQYSRLVAHTAGVREQSMATFGTQAGTVPGAIARIGTQFKTFPIHAMNAMQFISRMNVDPGALENGIVQSGGTSFVKWAKYAALTSVMAFMSLRAKEAMKDIGHLEVPSEELFTSPPTTDEIRESIGRSGSTGLAGEFVLQQPEKFGASYWDTLVGPTFGQFPEGMRILNNKNKYGKPMDKPGHLEKREMGVLGMIRKNSPGQNSWLFKGAYDYVQHDVLNEMIQAGSASKYHHFMNKIEKQEHGKK